MTASIDARSELAPAGFFSRLTAFVVDLVVLSAAIGATTWVAQSLEILLRPGTRIDLAVALRLVLPLFVAAYYVVSWTIFGQTVGKRLFGLRVVAVDGGRVGFARALLRLAGYFLSALPAYAGFVWVLVDRRRRGWHDMLARTLVVYERSRETRRPIVDRPATVERDERAELGGRAYGGSPTAA